MERRLTKKINKIIHNIDSVTNDITKPSVYILLFGMIMSILLCLAILFVYYFACDNNTMFDSIHIIHALYDTIPAVLLCSLIPAMLWDLAEREIRYKKK